MKSKKIIISHFHTDHLYALRDFPKAKFIYHQESYQSIHHISRFQDLLKAFLLDLLPEDFKQRLRKLKRNEKVTLPSNIKPFNTGYDLFGDGSLFAVETPGYAAGHIGIYFEADKPTLLIGDILWHL